MEFRSVENNYGNNGYNNRYREHENYGQQNNEYRKNNYQNNGGNRFQNNGYKNNGNNNFRKKEPPKNAYVIYTDGGCIMRENPPIGAWAFVDPAKGYSESEACENTTNNKMELTAAIKALEYIHKRHSEGLQGPFMIKSDSMYVVKGSAFWIKNWKKNNWQRIDTKTNQIVGEVMNSDLWKRIDELSQGLDIWWEHVDGHSGNEFNEMCDRLVKEKMNNYRTN